MKAKTWLAMSAIYIIWGSTYLAIRFTVETIPPFMSAGLRFLIAAVIIYIWRRLSGDPLPTRRQWRDTAIVGLLLLLGGNGLVSWAEQKVPSGITALIIGSVPLWLTLVEALRPSGTKPGWRGLMGLLIGFTGIALLVGPAEFGQASAQFDLAGIAALLLASFLWSLGSVYSKTADFPKSSILVTGMEMFAGSSGLFIMSGLTGEFSRVRPEAISAASLLGLAYLIAVGSLIGFVAYAWLLRNAPISLVSTYAYVNPVVAVFLGALLADELVNMRIIVAAAVIVGAVVLINTSTQAKIVQEEEIAAPVPD
jgi:drug/metabolite transporter (DMT)-like permease